MCSIEEYELPTYEAYLLADNKDEFINNLIPGSDSHFYFTLLRALQAAGTEKLSEQDQKNLESYSKFTTARSRSIKFRAVLAKLSETGESKEKQEALETLRKEIFQSYEFNHPQPSNISASKLTKSTTKIPSVLDTKVVDLDLTKAYLNRASIDELDNSVLSRLDTIKLTMSPPEVIEQFLQRADISSLERIPVLIYTLFEKRRQGLRNYFVPISYLGRLSLQQIKELGDLIPEIKRSKEYVGEVFVREFKIESNLNDDFAELPHGERQERWERLLKMYTWTEALVMVFPNLRQQILYELLQSGVECGIYNRDHFLEFLKNPGQDYNSMSKNHAEYLSQNHINQENYWEPILQFAVGRYKNPDQLIRIYLEHYFRDAKDLQPFEDYLDHRFLEQLFYRIKLSQGESVPDINKIFSTSEIKRMTDAKEITFLDHNRSFFKHGEEVLLEISVKNVPSIVVKVFEFNVENYYKKYPKVVDGTINLDGIVASEEQVIEFKDIPILKSRRELKFETIAKKTQGVFIVDLIGGGLSSRAVIKKGRLNFIQINNLNGHLLTIIDENFKVVKGSRVGLWFDNIFHEANSEGQVLLPYGLSKKSGPLILINGDFAELLHFSVKAESYTFRCAYIYNTESFLMGNKAKILIQPRLYVNGKIPANLGLLKDTKVTVITTNDLNIPNVTLLENLALDHRKDIEVEFPVPAKLTSLKIEVKVLLDQVNSSTQKELIDSHTIGIMNYVGQDIFSNLYLKSTSKGYEVHLLGKNGEPKSNIQMNISLTHRYKRKNITQTLETDEDGKIKLGLLPDVTLINASISRIGDIAGTSKTWPLDERYRINYPDQEIKLIEGDKLNFPVLCNQVHADKLAFVEKIGVRTIANLLSSLKIENGVLKLPSLSAGEYTLTFKDQSRTLNILVLKGEYWNKNYIRYKCELIEVRNQINNIVIKDTHLIPNEKDTELCDFKINLYADQREITRVHVIAHQFISENRDKIAESLQKIGASSAPQIISNNLKKSLFLSNRRLGDEYAYVLDRKNQTRYIGNTLERPPILLKRESVRDTTTRQEVLRSDEDFLEDDTFMGGARAEARGRRGVPERAKVKADLKCHVPEMMPQTGKSAEPGSVGGGFDIFLNFLKAPSQLYSNLTIGENGSVVIKDFPYKLFSSIQVIASNLSANISQTFPLPAHPIQIKDQTLKSQLKKDKFYSIARGTSQVVKGKTLDIKDLTSTEIQVVDSLQKLFDVEKQLRLCDGNDNEEGRTFEYWSFLKNWNMLTFEEKVDKYDKNASHELNVFLYFRDSEFFSKVAKPFIHNKIQKDLVDNFLLGNEKKMLEFAEPERIENLSALEMILLIVGLRKNYKDHANAIAEKIENVVRLSKFDTQTFKRCFDTVLNSRTEEDKQKFDHIKTEGSAKPKAQSEISMSQTASRGAREVMANRRGVPESRAYGIEKATFIKTEKAYVGADDGIQLESASSYQSKSFTKQLEQRKFLRSGFQEPEKTKEYKERTYFNKNNRFSPNLFWSELAKYLANNNPDTPFITQSFIYSARNHTEMLSVLTFISLPFQSGNHTYRSLGGLGLQIGAESDMIVFHKEIKEGQPELNSNILIAQRFFDPADRYSRSDEDPSKVFEKNPKEYVINKIYGCQVVVTNCSIAEQEFQVLCEIPEGSIPVRTIDYTKSHTIRLSSYTTTQIEYYFYFPHIGNFQIYPANVAKDGLVFALAQEKEFRVVAEKTIVDLETLTDILSKGSHEDILTFMKTKNIWNINIFSIESIYWLLKDKEFYIKVVDTLRTRKYFNMVVWSYSLYHNDHQSLAEFLASSASIQQFSRFFIYIDLPLLKIDNSKILEYHPLVNARIHMLAHDKTNILNNQYREQYKQFIGYLTELGQPTQGGLLVWVYYLLLQDRVDQAIAIYKKIDPKEISTTLEQQLQYDYLSAYLDFYTGYPKFSVARDVIEKYLSYPILSWRSLFIEIANQLAEFDGEDIHEEDLNPKRQEEDAKKSNLKGAEREASLSTELEAKTLVVTYQNISEFTVNIYEINLEILFSRNPFLSQGTEDFAFVRPNFSQRIEVTKDQSLEKTKYQIPKHFENNNLFIQVSSTAKPTNVTYFSTSLKVQIIENYGQIKVNDHANKPLTKVYVKCFAKDKSGKVSFYKDGYTDLRGRFDYASLNTQDLKSFEKFSILVMSDEFGSLIREAAPPAVVGKVEGNLMIKSQDPKWKVFKEANQKQEMISKSKFY